MELDVGYMIYGQLNPVIPRKDHADHVGQLATNLAVGTGTSSH